MYKVPYGLDVSVEIIQRNGNKHVIVNAPMYMNKQWEMLHCYSSVFSDYEILKDRQFNTVLRERYGV